MIKQMPNSIERFLLTIDYMNGQRLNRIVYSYEEVYNLLIMMSFENAEMLCQDLFFKGYVNDYLKLGTDNFINKGVFIKELKIKEMDDEHK